MPSSFKILIADPFNDRFFEKLRDQLPDVEMLTEKSKSKDAEVLIVKTRTSVDENLLQKLPALKQVLRAGNGIDHIDQKATKKRGIRVEHCPEASVTSAAELSCLMILLCARPIQRSPENLKKGHWRDSFPLGIELKTKTLGIIGFGRIGKQVAQRMQAFGMKVLAYDPYIPQQDFEQSGVTKSNLASLCQQSDFVSFHTPLTPETKNMANTSFFKNLKPGAALINCARGKIVNLDALEKALNKDSELRAGFDVFPKEPFPKDHWMIEHPRVMLSTHCGAWTKEAQRRVEEEVIYKLKAYQQERRNLGS